MVSLERALEKRRFDHMKRVRLPMRPLIYLLVAAFKNEELVE